jgi:hypothetical protein
VGKWTSEDVARGLQDFIICVEMLPMSLAFAYAFGARSFLEPDSTHLLSEIEGLGNVLKNYRVTTPLPAFVPRSRSSNPCSDSPTRMHRCTCNVRIGATTQFRSGDAKLQGRGRCARRARRHLPIVRQGSSQTRCRRRLPLTLGRGTTRARCKTGLAYEGRHH